MNRKNVSASIVQIGHNQRFLPPSTQILYEQICLVFASLPGVVKVKLSRCDGGEY